MLKRYIQSFSCRFVEADEEATAMKEIAQGLPPRSVRRMSRMGVMLSAVMEDVSLDMDTAVVYGTTYSESKALEAFLDSMPYASPTSFQTSIHPGGLEQALILKKQSIGAFFPVAGTVNDLVVNLLRCAFLSGRPRAVVCGGEERGNWLCEFDLAYERSFAFSLVLDETTDHGLGEISWDPQSKDVTERPSLEEVIRRMDRGESCRFGDAGHGAFEWKLP